MIEFSKYLIPFVSESPILTMLLWFVISAIVTVSSVIHQNINTEGFGPWNLLIEMGQGGLFLSRRFLIVTLFFCVLPGVNIIWVLLILLIHLISIFNKSKKAISNYIKTPKNKVIKQSFSAWMDKDAF